LRLRLKKRTSINSIPKFTKEKEMADFRRLLYVFAAVAFLASLAVPAYADFTCSNFTAVNVSGRTEGFTELVGDIVFSCTGGTPTILNSAVPQVNITVSANTNITSRVLATLTVKGAGVTQFNEALLMIDNPNTSAYNPHGRRLRNCGTDGEDVGPSGPGVCAIISDGNPADTYDGSSFTSGNTGCEGTYGCGRPNVFQGRQAVSLLTGQPNVVLFQGVPFDPPGTTIDRHIRISNLRVDATRFGSPNPFSVVPVTATVSFASNTSISVPDTTVTVAQVESGMTNKVYASLGFLQCIDTSDPSNQHLDVNEESFSTNLESNSKEDPFAAGSNKDSPTKTMDIHLEETFPSSWKVRNLQQTIDNGHFVGGTDYAWNGFGVGVGEKWFATDLKQNVPGGTYFTESGFVNCPAANGCKDAGGSGANPPNGFGGTVQFDAANAPVEFGDPVGLTGIEDAGRATQGTRFSIQIGSMPTGARLFFPITVLLRNTSTGGPTGVMVLDSSADQNGADNNAVPGKFTRAKPTSADPEGPGGTPPGVPDEGNGGWWEVKASAPVVTYEVLFEDPIAREFADIVPAILYKGNLTTNSPQPGVVATASVSFAPVCTGSGCNEPQPDGDFGTPRFTSGFKTPGDPLYSIEKCACDLLFPWVVSSGSIDTGIVIANTSLDPCGGTPCTAGFTAVPQAGIVTFYYFGTVGIGDQNPVANLAPNVSNSVAAGGYVAHVLSQNTSASNGLGSRPNFAGYVIAQAQFQYCHGVVDITLGSTPIFNYVGLVLDKGAPLSRTNQAFQDALGH
jgi:hypothetical protein